MPIIRGELLSFSVQDANGNYVKVPLDEAFASVPVVGQRREISDDDRRRFYRITRCTLCNGLLCKPSALAASTTPGTFVSPDGIAHNACIETAQMFADAGFPG